jgi:D-arabinose 1-dehydrogenase-like Zn-dependent alcohol dehydrogenase
MKAAQITTAGGPFELVDRPIPEPGRGEARIRVEACGICHSDAFVKHAAFPGLTLPRVPGHEVAGVVDAVGLDAGPWKPGDRVGVGWHGGHCFRCEPCRRGDFVSCVNGSITGITRDGGYAAYMVAPHEALARIPAGLTAVEAAPLLCAGITTFNALRHSPAGAGDLVAIQGLGGLGHLGIQFANKLGFRVAALSRGSDKRALALELGAHEYIDTAAVNPAEALQALGGARVLLATAPDAGAVESGLGGLAAGGQLLLVAAFQEPIRVPAIVLISGRRSIQGWPSGTARDSEDTLEFAALTGVRPRVEVFPLARVNEAYERMIGNRARFRVVLTMA